MKPLLMRKLQKSRRDFVIAETGKVPSTSSADIEDGRRLAVLLSDGRNEIHCDAESLKRQFRALAVILAT
jgi:hypothetical protein